MIKQKDFKGHQRSTPLPSSSLDISYFKKLYSTLHEINQDAKKVQADKEDEIFKLNAKDGEMEDQK